MMRIGSDSPGRSLEHVLVVTEILARGLLPDGRSGIVIRDQHGTIHELPDDLGLGINSAEIRENTRLHGRFRLRTITELVHFEPAQQAA